jgi:hypothetical protein
MVQKGKYRLVKTGCVALLVFCMGASGLAHAAATKNGGGGTAADPCKWGLVGEPVKQGSTSIGGRAIVQCIAKVDWAYTRAALEIREDGQWRTYGKGEKKDETGPTIVVYDGAPGKHGCHEYRMKYTHQGKYQNRHYSLPTQETKKEKICVTRIDQVPKPRKPAD